MTIQDTTTYDILRESILQYDQSTIKWSSMMPWGTTTQNDLPTPMEIGRIKGKGKDGKGKGKGYKGFDKGSKGKGKGDKGSMDFGFLDLRNYFVIVFELFAIWPREFQLLYAVHPFTSDSRTDPVVFICGVIGAPTLGS